MSDGNSTVLGRCEEACTVVLRCVDWLLMCCCLFSDLCVELVAGVLLAF